MSRYSTQTDLKNKYIKYLDKLDDAINRHHNSKYDTYKQKLGLYGMLIQSGGTLDDSIKNAMASITESLNRLNTESDATDVANKIKSVKNSFDTIANKYAKTSTNFLQQATNIKNKIDNVNPNKMADMKELDDLLAESENIDDYITRVGIRSVLVDIGDPSKDLNDHKIDNLWELSLYGPDANSYIESMKTGNAGIPQDINKANALEKGILFAQDVYYMRNNPPSGKYGEEIINRLNNENNDEYTQYLSHFLPQIENKNLANEWISKLKQNPKAEVIFSPEELREE